MSQKKHKKIVFISYSSKDVEVAESVHAQLQKEGLSVWRDKTRIEADWSRDIATALANADVVCLLWGKSAAESAWVGHEWLTARALEKPIVVCDIHQKVPEIPLPLRNLDRCHATDESGLRQLVHRLWQSKKDFDYEYALLPSRSFIPFNPNPDFTGRHTELLDLYLSVVGDLNKIGSSRLGLVGMGGLGKTQLAVEFAYRFSFAFDSVFWIQAADRKLWLQQIIRLARDYLGLKVADPEGPDASSQYMIALKKYCSEKNLLLIMDNVEEPHALHGDDAFGYASVDTGISPITLGSTLVFTTRKRIDLPDVHWHSLTSLSKRAAYRLLTRRRRPDNEDEETCAHEICETVGRLPLAIVLAGSYLAKYARISFHDYLTEAIRDPLETVDSGRISPEALATRHEAAIGKTLTSQWRALTDDTARALLLLCAAFPETNIIPIRRLFLLADIPLPRSRIHDPLGDALNPLLELSLVESLGTDSIRLHPLVYAFTRQQISADAFERIRQKAARRMSSIYKEPERLETEWASRGVEAVYTDLKMGSAWANNSSHEQEHLASIEMLVDREKHHLHPLSDDGPPISLRQQLHYRAFRLGLFDLAASFVQNLGTGPVLHGFSSSLYEDIACTRRLTGHSQVVSALDISADGHLAISGSWDNSLILWDIETGTPLRRFKGATKGNISSVRIDARGRRAVSGSDSGAIIWDLTSNEPLRTLHADKDKGEKARAVAISADGRISVSAHTRELKPGDHGTIIIVYDIEADQELKHLLHDSGWPSAIDVSQDGRVIVCASSDGLEVWLAIWELGRVEPRFLIRGQCQLIRCVRLRKDGIRFLTGSDDHTIGLWDVTRGVKLTSLRGHVDSVYAVGWGPNDRNVVSAGGKGEFIRWDLEKRMPIRHYRGHADIVTSLGVNIGSAKAVTGGYNHSVVVWDLDHQSEPKGKKVHLGSVSVRLLNDGKRALTSGWSHTYAEGKLVEWRVDSAEPIRMIDIGEKVYNLVINESGTRAFLKTSGRWFLLNLDSEERTEIPHPDEDNFNAMALSEDAKVLVCANIYTNVNQGDLCVYELPSGDLRWLLHGHLDQAKTALIEPNGSRALSASWDHTLRLWDLDTGQCLKTFNYHAGFREVSWNLHRTQALSGASEGALVLWDLHTGDILAELMHPGGVNSVALGENGCGISVGHDRTLILWDLVRGIALRRLALDVLPSSVSLVGDTVAVGDFAGQIHFLKIQSPSK